MFSVLFSLHTLQTVMVIIVVSNNQRKQMRRKKLLGRVCKSVSIRALLDVLGDPLEPITIAHLADNTAHEHLKRPDIGVAEADLALPSCEVAKA